VKARLHESFRAFAGVFANPNLRRLELAWAGSVTGEWASTVALSVFAYEAGGTAAVGLVVVIRMLPAAIAAPFAAVASDRFPRERVMVAADLVRAFSVTGAAVGVFADAPPGVVYALAGLVAVVSTAFRPAQAALVPSLAKSPDELTAANVASSTIESVAFFAGPAVGGLVLAVTSPGVVFAMQAAAFVWSALLVLRIQVERTDEPGKSERERRFAHELLAGFRTIGVDSRLRLLVGLFAGQTLVHGALNVLIVVMAIELLELGVGGVGFLTSADGAGGLVGAFAVVALIGRRRLASDFRIGIVLWGAPIALIGVWPDPALALVLLGVVGVANTIVDVAGLTLLQRAVDDDVLARVFGILETVVLATIALGAVLALPLVSALGVRGALVATGAFLPLLAAVFWRRLGALDSLAPAPARELDLLRSIPMFAPLPVPTLEILASNLTSTRVGAGQLVFRQGDSGDRFYVIGEGEIEITVDGRSTAELGPGDYFGEIALLRDVPRTASASARTDVFLFALEREEFIGAVTGHPASAEAADAVISARLGSLRPSVGSL
jgi:predicted MFS family arabinose efflux permease